jgi:GDPmannose 4,6-dehydratase
LINKLKDGFIKKGEYFNIAGVEKFKLTEVVDIAKNMANVEFEVKQDPERMRPIDADYQLFTCEKFNKAVPEWRPEIKVRDMFKDLLDYWRNEIKEGRIPLNR